jgi:hypothetical protein
LWRATSEEPVLSLPKESQRRMEEILRWFHVVTKGSERTRSELVLSLSKE